MINPKKNSVQSRNVKHSQIKGKNANSPTVRPKTKKKKKAVKHGLIKMIFIWILCILLAIAVGMRFWHYITYHWIK
jgi:type VI protein secretion system component VasF